MCGENELNTHPQECLKRLSMIALSLLLIVMHHHLAIAQHESGKAFESGGVRDGIRGQGSNSEQRGLLPVRCALPWLSTNLNKRITLETALHK